MLRQNTDSELFPDSTDSLPNSEPFDLRLKKKTPFHSKSGHIVLLESHKCG